MTYRSLYNLIFLLGFSTSYLMAGEVRVETKYFMEGIPKSSTLPAVSPSWPVFSKKKIAKVKGGESVEFLAGADEGTSLWEVGNRVVSITRDGEAIVSEKLQDGAARDADISWASKLEPAKKEKQNGAEILIYEANGGFRRLWVSSKTGHLIAASEGRFITFFEISDDKTEASLPDNVIKALTREKEQQKRLSEMGAMPQ